MKISELLHRGKPLLSFEVFPPKSNPNYDAIRTATEEIAALRPHFMSVTCGAGGNSPQNSGYTVDIAANLQNRFSLTAVVGIVCNIDKHLFQGNADRGLRAVR